MTTFKDMEALIRDRETFEVESSQIDPAQIKIKTVYALAEARTDAIIKEQYKGSFSLELRNKIFREQLAIAKQEAVEEMEFENQIRQATNQQQDDATRRRLRDKQIRNLSDQMDPDILDDHKIRWAKDDVLYDVRTTRPGQVLDWYSAIAKTFNVQDTEAVHKLMSYPTTQLMSKEYLARLLTFTDNQDTLNAIFGNQDSLDINTFASNCAALQTALSEGRIKTAKEFVNIATTDLNTRMDTNDRRLETINGIEQQLKDKRDSAYKQAMDLLDSSDNTPSA